MTQVRVVVGQGAWQRHYTSYQLKPVGESDNLRPERASSVARGCVICQSQHHGNARHRLERPRPAIDKHVESPGSHPVPADGGVVLSIRPNQGRGWPRCAAGCREVSSTREHAFTLCTMADSRAV